MRRKIPSLQALACFDAAARHESYTRAAQELALTQSAVSRQIGALEDFLGIALFRRTRHGVALTPAGADYARQIAPRLQALERDTLNAMAHQGSTRSVSLAAVPTFATRWLIPRLNDLAAHHPDLLVHIETRTRPFMFAETEFDAALYAGTPEQVANWAGTRALPLMDEEVVPVCAPGLLKHKGRATARATPLQISQLPLLQQSTRPNAWRQWFDAMGVAGDHALSGPRHELFSMTAEAAIHGMGVALVPTLLIEAELARGALVVACPKPMKSGRTYYLVMPDVAEPPPALQAFADWLVGGLLKRPAHVKRSRLRS